MQKYAEHLFPIRHRSYDEYTHLDDKNIFFRDIHDEKENHSDSMFDNNVRASLIRLPRRRHNLYHKKYSTEECRMYLVSFSASSIG